MSDRKKDWRDFLKEVEPLGKGAGKIPPASQKKMAGNPVNYANFVIKRDENKTVLAYQPGFDPKSLKALRSSSFRPEARLDLHGMTQTEAEAALLRFYGQQKAQGRRQLLVIHGKGLHSEDGVGVLAEMVFRFFCHGPAAPDVLALSSAHPALGGSGALTIRLRKFHEPSVRS
ncbi:MAG: Smr/MutS family protein [Myxococcales bacterium]|nr:MAG: Smr/MutS family protein [Myxococcales bacterium]